MARAILTQRRRLLCRRIAGEIPHTLNAEVVQIRFHARHIQLACGVTQGTCTDDIKKHVTEILTVTQKMYGCGRQLVRNLRPESIDALGVQGAIAQAVQAMSNLPPSCEFIFQGRRRRSARKRPGFDGGYRVVLKALMNAAKHAEAGHVVVSLQAEGAKRVRMVVMDEGNGFDRGGRLRIR